jgi:hypothetical protein
MSLFGKILEWANIGTGIETPSESKQNTGWGASEQPPYQWFNWHMNRADVENNAIAQVLNERGTQSPANPNFDAISELYHGNRDWLNLADGPNRKGFTGPSIGVINMCRGWNFDLSQEVVWAVDQYDYTHIVQIRNDKETFLIEGESFAVTLDTVNEVITDLCCDGDYVYLLAYQGAADPQPGAAKIYKFQANPWSATPVWVRSLTTHFLDVNTEGENRIIVADPDTLAMLFRGVNSELDTEDAIGILAKDNSTFLSGSGNAAAVATHFAGTGLCTDGVNVYFTIESVSQPNYFCAARITDPTTALVSTRQSIDPKIVGDIVFDGRYVCLISVQDTPARFRIDVYQRNPELMAAYNQIDAALPNGGSDRVPIIFDGMRCWAVGTQESSTNNYNAFITSWVNYYNSTDSPTITELDSKKHFLGGMTAGLTSEVVKKVRMCYADGCIWISPEVDPTATASLIVRMPNVLARQ